MIRQRAGRIINISSVVGCAGNVAQSIYGMTKAAMNNLTMTASKEFAQYGILVNAVAPGFIRTSMTEKIPEEFAEVFMKQIPLGRMGNPEEVGEVVQFLATSANYCTGSIFHVNGGMYGG
jgi:3-oxoacyl-[acyl-carrier protein] reductase